MELVTGRAGSPHITSQQDRQKHQGIWGDGAYILATGNMLEPEVQSSNKILIKDGALMFQGALFTVKVGTTDEITINNGNQGMQRKDLVVARYKYDSSQNIESAEWVVIQGTPAASNPVAPGGTSGDIQAGDSTVDCPFMVVNLDGINVTGVDIIPEKIPTLPDLIGNISNILQKQSKDNRINVSAGQKAVSYIIIDAIDGYTPVLATVWSSHVTTTTSDARIVDDRVMFCFDATSNQTPETFTADVVYIKNL